MISGIPCSWIILSNSFIAFLTYSFEVNVWSLGIAKHLSWYVWTLFSSTYEEKLIWANANLLIFTELNQLVFIFKTDTLAYSAIPSACFLKNIPCVESCESG